MVRKFFYVFAGMLMLAGALPTVASAQAWAYLSQWGSFGSGSGQFLLPTGVAVDAGGNVYVGDSGNHRIQVFTSTGTYLTEWGGFGSGNGQLNVPFGVAVDASGNVYVVDENNYRIQVFTSSGTYVAQWGGFGSGNGQFY